MTTTETLLKNIVEAQQVLLRRSGKVLPEQERPSERADEAVLAAFVQNLDSVGYGVSPELFAQLEMMSTPQLEALDDWLMPTLKEMRGGKPFAPMYPNFPREVMEMNRAQLYINAIRHYLSSGTWFPNISPKDRPKLDERGNETTLRLGETEDLKQIFQRLVSSNASISASDKEDVKALVRFFGIDCLALIPDTIPNRENKATLLASLLAIPHTDSGMEAAKKHCSTATDVLRLAAAMSAGDVSLAASCKFRKFNRRERRSLLEILEHQNNITEDMLRWKERWKRLGERLHPGEHRKSYPKTCEAFDVLRKDSKFEKFNTVIEVALNQRNPAWATEILRLRPGDFARRLDHVLRLAKPTEHELVVAEFEKVAEKVSTPVLLQVMHHFSHRFTAGDLRVFLPKGEVGKAQVIENKLADLPHLISDAVARVCRKTLIARFAKLPSLGKCYLDPGLRKFTVPGSQRSAAKSLRTIARGSRLQLPDADTLRFFIWWKNGKQRTDLDLSAALFDDKFFHNTTVAYYNLKDFGGCHSGDIVDAPEGASEFIDISISQCLKKKVRYIVMCVNSFTMQPYCDLPECFAGWMARKKPDSGEIYEPRTVFDRIDLAANTKIAMPAIFDLVNREVIWLDLSLKGIPRWQNNVASNLPNIQLMLRAFATRTWPCLYDLFAMHIDARGELVESESEADTVFSVANETPFRIDKIAAEFMAN